MKSKNLSENILKSVRLKGFKYIKLDSVITESSLIYLNPFNLTDLRIFSDKFFDFIYKFISTY